MLVKEILVDTYKSIIYHVKESLMNVFWMVVLILPYLMLCMGQYIAIQRQRIAFGGEWFIPIIAYLILYYIKSYANKVGKGTTIPIPRKRFTNESEEGQVDIEIERLQELILYVDEIENWFERRGLLNEEHFED